MNMVKSKTQGTVWFKFVKYLLKLFCQCREEFKSNYWNYMHFKGKKFNSNKNKGKLVQEFDQKINNQLSN